MQQRQESVASCWQAVGELLASLAGGPVVAAAHLLLLQLLLLLLVM